MLEYYKGWKLTCVRDKKNDQERVCQNYNFMESHQSPTQKILLQ